MRIVFLTPSARLGGADVVLLDLLAGLVETRPSWQLSLIVAADGPLVPRARERGIDVHVLPFPATLARLGERSYDNRRSSRLAFWWGLARTAVPAWRYRTRLRALIATLAPAIVQTNGLKMHLLGAVTTPRDTPLLWHLHDYVSPRRASAFLLARLAHRCSALVTNSQSVAADVARLPGAWPPTQAIRCGVDPTRYTPDGERMDLDARASLPAPEEPVVRVGLVATFAVWKGHTTFLEAIARLPPGLPVRAYVIGGEVYETSGSQTSLAELRDAAIRLGIGARVGFTGFVDDPGAAMRALDVVVHASTEPEPFGLTIAEAMACGRAVIASQGGGAAEIVSPDVDALTTPPGDAAALARAITQLATDTSLRLRLGHAARTAAGQRFSCRRFVDEFLDVYASLTPSTPLRVLHLHSGNLYGGVETMLATMARHAPIVPDMTSLFALCFDGRLAGELRAAGHPVHLLGGVRTSRPLTIRRARRVLARRLADLKIDVVVCHQAWPLALFGPTIRRAGLPLVLWVHTTGNGRHWLDRWAQRIAPDLVIANSRFTVESIARTRQDSPVELVYCPVAPPAGTDARQRRQLRRSLDTPDDHVVIVQAGRLESGKGNRQTIEALATLRDVDRWTHWVIGGPQRRSDEQTLRELEDVAQRRGIRDRVRFVGERQDVGALLAAADIYCQPNTRPEPFGLALVEAQAAGLPIVTSAFGGALEIVDDRCGRLVPPGDTAAVAAALRGLLDDADLRARLGHAARARSSLHCDVSRQLRRTHEVLANVARGRSPAPPRPSVLGSPLIGDAND